MITTHSSLNIHAEVETLRPKCWRCDDAGHLESRSIVPRFPACVCETGQNAIEGRDFHKRHPSNRFARPS